MSLDLNLIRTFLSIYDHRSVTRAAQELSLTQPTVSHALGSCGAPFMTRCSSAARPDTRPQPEPRNWRRCSVRRCSPLTTPWTRTGCSIPPALPGHSGCA
ncbi:LysR family transcriptional regulator [Pseudarthrobacter sp. So.54]